MKTRMLGNLGEKYAARFLQERGYRVIASNFTVRMGEIDIVAQKNGLFVFIEVKTRTGDAFGMGEEAVTQVKKHRIKSAIARFIADKLHGGDVDYRFDIIDVVLGPTSLALKNIEHFEDIEL